MALETAPHSAREFRHSALITDSDATLRAVLVPEIRRALGTGDGAFLAVSEHTAAVVRAELGDLAEQLQWGNTDAFYQRLGFTFEEFRRFLADVHASGTRLHVFAEPNVETDLDGREPVDRVAAYLPYEAMCNEVYAQYGCEVTCLWDSRRHPSLVIENVRRLHNHELVAGGRTANPEFVDPVAYVTGRNDIPLPEPPAQLDVDTSVLDLEALALLRASVGEWAEQHGFEPFAVFDVQLATYEVAANALTHGEPPVRARCWRHGDTLVVQLDDHGQARVPALAGYQPPEQYPTAGRGLWVARQLADVVQIHSPAEGTSVRLHFPRELTHRDPSWETSR